MNYFKSFKNKNSGFTLLELLIVIVIIGVFASIVLYALNDARSKGSEAGVKSNLSSARTQAEVFFNTNTTNPNSYTGVCSNAVVGGVMGIGLNVYTAARAAGLSGYGTNIAGTLATATCRTDGNNWAAEVPLKSGGMWCVDSMNRSLKRTVTIGSGYTCN